MEIRNIISRHITRDPVVLLALIVGATVMSIVVSLWIVSLRGADTPRASDFSTETAAPGPVNETGPRTGPVIVYGPPSIPAPDYFSTAWQTDKRQIAPGDTIAITFSMESIWDEPLEFTNLPSSATLNLHDNDSDEQVQVRLEWSGVASGILEPGEEITAIARIASDMSAGLQPGRYYGFLDDVSFVRGSADRGQRKAVLGFSSGVLFVVSPSEGALEKPLPMKQVRETKEYP